MPSNKLDFIISIYGLGLVMCSNSELLLNYEVVRHLVWLPGRGISPTQGLYLHTTAQHRKTRTHIHALRGIRTQNLSIQAAKILDRAATVIILFCIC
jgi:hypothetical protein